MKSFYKVRANKLYLYERKMLFKKWQPNFETVESLLDFLYDKPSDDD